MIYIAPEDIGKIQEVIDRVFQILTIPTVAKMEKWVNLGDNVKVLRVKGYGVGNDTIRIDIKVMK